MLNKIETVQFTELIGHNPKVLSLFSPSGFLVASALQTQLHIWNVNSKQISHKFECDSSIDFIKWSPDSELICCGMLKDSIQVWKLDVPHWRCKISGCLAFVNIHWDPSSQYLLVISEFNIKATVYSLVSSVVTEIDNPKAIENCIAISPCEKYIAVAQRVKFEDCIGVYSSETLETIKTFPTETKDLMSIFFSPSELMIAVLENAIIEYKILFYSIDGRLLGKHLSEANFGPVSFNWNFTKNFAAFGDCLGEVKVVNCSDFEVIASYQHPDVVDSNDITLYKVAEQTSETKNDPSKAVSSFFELDEVVRNRPISIVQPMPDSKKGKGKNPLKCGVQMLTFSTNGKFIASVTDQMPKTVFIYDTEKLKLLDVIIRGSNVKSICWHPVKPYLVICSSSNAFDMWTPDGCIRYISSFTSDFLISNATWSSAGDSILLNSRDHFSIAFFS